MDKHDKLILAKIGNIDKMVNRSLTTYENGLANIRGYISALVDTGLIEPNRGDLPISIYIEKYVGTPEQRENATAQLKYLLFSLENGVAL